MFFENYRIKIFCHNFSNCSFVLLEMKILLRLLNVNQTLRSATKVYAQQFREVVLWTQNHIIILYALQPVSFQVNIFYHHQHNQFLYHTDRCGNVEKKFTKWTIVNRAFGFNLKNLRAYGIFLFIFNCVFSFFQI